MAGSQTTQESEALRHWSSFGRRGEPPQVRVTAGSWETQTMLKPITSTWDQQVPSSEVNKILYGFKPKQMEDKWFVYADGPNNSGLAVVRFARSWTGFVLAEVKMQLSDGDAKFTEIEWETSSERCNGQTEEKAKKMVQETLRWCMGVEL